MRRDALLITVAVLASWCIVGNVFAADAQSLATVARVEEARRKTVETPSKVYTNEDLKGSSRPRRPDRETADEAGRGKDASARTVVPGDADPDDVTPEDQETESPGSDEDHWRERMSSLRSSLEREEVLLDALESRVSALTADFVNRDDPAERALISADRERALAEIERVTSDIERLRAEINEVQEEARQAGIPPGWLR